jgi:hypothetical protein
MAIDVDWLGVATNAYRIYVPRADMPVVQVSPEVRELDADAFRKDLRDLEASEEGMLWPKTHTHVTEVSQSGLNYARFVSIDDPYVLEFEDGQYAVRVTGANVNFLDVKVENQVSLLVQNSAGLVNLDAVLRKFEDTIYFNEDAGNTGTSATDGTRDNPVSSVDAALTLVASQGKIGVTIIKGSFVLDRDVTDLLFTGSGNPRTSLVNLNGRTLDTCKFERLTVTGNANSSVITTIECLLTGLTNVCGSFERSYVADVVLDTGADGVIFEECRSIVPGVTSQCLVDCNGREGFVQLNAWMGSLRLENLTNALTAVNVEMQAGDVVLAANCTAAFEVVVRGVGLLDDQSSIGDAINDLGLQSPAATRAAVLPDLTSVSALVERVRDLIEADYDATTSLLTIRNRDTGAVMLTKTITGGAVVATTVEDA